jgi:hypothetical protein
MVAVLLGFVLLAIHETGWGKHTPKLEMRAGFWMLPWLGGVTLISWLGRYPALDKHAGNLGWLDMVSGVVVIVIFSALIMGLAHALRLRGQAVVGQLETHKARVADHPSSPARSQAAGELPD